MKHLMIDTSEYAVIGIYDDSGEYPDRWLAYEPLLEKQSSSVIHKKLFEILSANNIEIASIDALIVASGPGSYTGIRVSEGIAQILSWHKKPVFSFYHFELPEMIGIQQGLFYSYAFKNEYFLYTWNGNSTQKKLISKDSLLKLFCTTSNIFTHYRETKFDGSTLTKETSQLLLANPTLLKKIFDSKIRREPFYYRALEEEFKQTCLE